MSINYLIPIFSLTSLGDAKGDTENDDTTPETKPKGKRGQKKADKPQPEEIEDTGELTSKRRRKADDKGN